MTRHATTGPAFEAGSVFEAQPPAAVYQTLISDGKQDSSSLLVMRVRLSTAAVRAFEHALRSGRPTHELVYGGIRHFDGTDVRMYDAETHSMQFLQLPQDLFRFDFLSGALRISVHRKYLPVSKCHGNAPFVFTFLIKPADEVLVTTPFTVLSKEPKVPDAPKAPVKRVRRPPPKPFAAEHSDEGRRISDYLSRAGPPAPSVVPAGPLVAPVPARARVRAPEAPSTVRTPSPAIVRPVVPDARHVPATAGIVMPADFEAATRRKRTRREAMDRPDSPGSALDALFDMAEPITGGGGGGGILDDELYMDATFGALSEDEFHLFVEESL